jgi:chromosome partitioning protein
MRSIAVVNQKGGVGKTTTVVNLGHALARLGYRVMLADIDPQGHLSACLGVYRPPGHGMDRVMLDGEALDRYAMPLRDGMTLVPCGDQLEDFGRDEKGKHLAGALRDAMRLTQTEADFLLIDCPPSSSLIAVNAIVAADDVLVPVAGDYLSLTGLARLMLTLKRLEPLRQSALSKRVFLSRFVERRRLAREVREKLREHFPEYLMDSAVSESAVLAECAGAGRSIFEYRPTSKAADEFRQLAENLIKHGTDGHEYQETSHVA